MDRWTTWIASASTTAPAGAATTPQAASTDDSSVTAATATAEALDAIETEARF